MAEHLIFPNKTVVFQQGDYEECMYRILNGSVSIYSDYNTEQERFLVKLDSGRYFGELGLLEARPRSATAVALAGSEIEKLTADDLEGFFLRDPDKALDLFATIASRLKDLSEDYSGICLLAAQYVDTTDSKDKLSILDRLKSLFVKQSSQDVSGAVRAHAKNPVALRSIEIESGAIICREGETENWMFDILSGSAGVYASYGTEEQKLLTVLKESDTFGEIAMLQHSPRTATVVAQEKTRVRVVTEDQFMSYFSDSPAKAYRILQNSAERMRELSFQFGEAYRLLMTYIDAEQAGKVTPVLLAQIKALATADR